MGDVKVPKATGTINLSKVYAGDDVFVETHYHQPGQGFRGKVRDLKQTDRSWMEVESGNIVPYPVSYPAIVQDRVFVVIPENDKHGRKPGVYAVKILEVKSLLKK